MEPYRILVVDDSPFMRAIFSDLILRDSEFTIVETASNGEEAVEAVKRLKPDAVTLDLEMPLMNGIEALQIIMKEEPTPVIMLSGISEQNMRETIKALQYGAFDFIRKPTSAVSDDITAVGELLIEKLKIAVMTHKKKRLSPTVFTPAAELESAAAAEDKEKKAAAPRPLSLYPKEKKLTDNIRKTGKPASGKEQAESKSDQTKEGTYKTNPVAPPPRKAAPAKPEIIPRVTELSFEPPVNLANKKNDVLSRLPVEFTHIVAIGTSTGGPRALHEVICSLPHDLPAPVLVVQHMPPKFTKSLAQRLDSFSPLKVVEAEQGEKVRAGVVYIAPGGSHMVMEQDSSGYRIKLTQEPPRNGHRPAVDVLFESLVPFKQLKRHAVIMTGMGSDGAKGMAALAESGAVTTIAEAEETCVVYGMPRCAVENGSAKLIVPLQQIAPNVVYNVLK